MKAGELLSSATISSSRALTFYAASVTAIMWTGTKPDTLPGLGHLDASNFTLYGIMTAVLSFMVSTHIINWRTDVTGEAAAKAIANFEAHLEKLETMDLNARVKEGPIEIEVEAQKVDVRYDDNLVVVKSKFFGRVFRIGLHLLVPLGFAIVACTELVVKLIE